MGSATSNLCFNLKQHFGVNLKHPNGPCAYFRQQRELDQLVEYEVKRAQIHAKAEAKLAKQEARARERFAAKQEKEKAWREALRNQELKRLAAEKEEEEKVKVADKACPRQSHESHPYTPAYVMQPAINPEV